MQAIWYPDEADIYFRGTGERFRAGTHYLMLVVMAAFTFYHVAELTRLVRISIQASELVYTSPTVDKEATSNCFRRVWRCITKRVERTFSSSLTTWRRLVFLYGIRGPHFERTVHAKELYEVFWEVIQVYRTMYHVVDPPAGFLATFVLATNCLTTPLIYTALPHPNSRATRFLLCLVIDAVLDHMSSTAIPLAVFASYRDAYAHNRQYDAAQFFTVASSLVQFAPNSMLLVGSRVLPSVSMVANLMAIKSVLKRRKKTESRVSNHRNSALAVRPTKLVEHPRIVPIPTATRPPSQPTPAVRAGRPCWMRLLHVLLFMNGLAAIGLTNIRNRDAAAEGLPGCKVAMGRWLVPRVPCAVLEVDCVASGFSRENQSEMTTLLERADRFALRALTFTNCASLVVPDVVREFSRLNWLEIRNATLLSWPDAAALTRVTTPHLSRLLIRESNVTEFPRVLSRVSDTRASLPRTLVDISFVSTNLTDLPESLHIAWPQPLASLHFERCGFTRVPSTLLAMQTSELSLAGNAIRELPPAFFQDRSFAQLSLAGNPIRALPASLASPLSLPASSLQSRLWLVGTPMATLPAWVCDFRGDIVASQSPLCTDRNATSSSFPCDASTSTATLRCDTPTPTRATAASLLSPMGFLPLA